jgi:putative membrane protein
VPKEEVYVVMMSGSWGWWGPGVIFMLLCMGMMMWMMMSHGHGSHGSHTAEPRGPAGAERILAERLARGEIDTEEYERRRAALQRTRQLDQT